MNYLKDTHILLWYIAGDNRIKEEIKLIIEKESNNLFLSNASLWEISIKINIGKLRLNGTLYDLKSFLETKGIIILEFDFDDLSTLQTLPFHHQDPFDRLIISQALTKSLSIITNDPKVKMYIQ